MAGEAAPMAMAGAGVAAGGVEANSSPTGATTTASSAPSTPQTSS